MNLIRVMPAKGQDVHTSLRIARIMGPVLVVVGLGLLINSKAYHAIAQQIMGAHPFIYFSGVLALVTGLAILNAHSVWTLDWRGLITGVGLFLTCVGVFRVMAPPYAAYLGGGLFAHREFFLGAGIVFLTLGGFISFKGYVGTSATPQQETTE